MDGESEFMAMANTQSAERNISGVERHFRLALLLSLMMGYAVLFTSGIYSVWYALPVLAAMVIGYRRFYSEESFILSQFGWTVFTVGLMLGLGALGLMGQMMVVDGLSLVLLVLPIVRLMNVMRPRDHLQIFALAFSQIVFGTILNSTLWFGIVLAAYIFVAMWGLILLSFKVTCERAPNPMDKKREVERDVLKPRYAWGVVGMAVLVVVTTFVIFFVVPRPGSALASFSFGIKKHTTGFGQEVSIGDVGKILQDKSVAMWVSVKVKGQPPDGPYYWKGAAYDRFDGIVWSESSFKRRRIDSTYKNFFRLVKNIPKHYLELEFFLDSYENTNIFHHGYLAAVMGNFRHLNQTHNGSTYIPSSDRFVQRYTSFAVQYQPYDLNDSVLKSYLQLPHNLDPRIGELARQVTQGIEGDYQKALKLTQYLNTNYGYSLEGEIVPSGDPLARFLFETKKGHCEYYASSLAIMLRTLGIHSKLIAGYKQGEYDSEEGVYLVRQSDAHAWVEAYIDDVWLTLDATPGGDLQSSMLSDVTDEFRRYIAMLRFRWQRYVISYSLRDQFEFLKQAGNSARGFSASNMTRFLRDNSRQIASTVFVLIIFALLIRRFSGFGLFAEKDKKSYTPQQLQAIAEYKSLLAFLAKKLSIEKRPGQTASELAREVLAEKPELAEIFDDFNLAYERLRFGEQSATDQDLKRFVLLAGRLRSELKE